MRVLSRGTLLCAAAAAVAPAAAERNFPHAEPELTVGRKEYERDRMLEEILPLQAQSAANVHYWWHDARDVQSHRHRWLKNEDLVGFGERRHTEFVRGIGSWTIRVKRQLRKFFKGFTNGAWGYVS